MMILTLGETFRVTDAATITLETLREGYGI